MAKGRGRLAQAQKAAKQQHQQQHQAKKQKTSNANNHGATSSAKAKAAHRQQQHLKPVIPFSPDDNILLAGEGDLSFAASLIEHHGCTRVTATVLEKDVEALAEKYPHAAANTAKILAANSRNNTADDSKDKEENDGNDDSEDDSRNADNSEADSNDNLTMSPTKTTTPPNCRILYNFDARKMPPFVIRPPKSQSYYSDPVGTIDRFIFNFPHVGGKSTDVNRQVRHNQQLLVAFFRCALPSLAPGGSVIVTLFEGEPYTLWNIRDLGRHAGLAVERSFVFRAEAYPGYHHARTLGVVRTKTGEISESGWKGEERAARSYVFVRKEDAPVQGKPGQKRKRKEQGVDDDDGDDDESGDDG